MGLVVTALGILLAGRGRSRLPDAKETAETVAWNAPGFSAVEPGQKARFVLRDGPVSVWSAQSGLALGLGGWALRWSLAGAQEVQPRGDGPLPGHVHRLVGDPSAWRTGLPTYGRLTFDGVYPGVRLTVESRRHAVAYRFDVAPGGDPRAIRMRYAGADEARVEEGGRALRVRVGGRALREDGLLCYQENSGARREVPCRYRLAGGGDGTQIAFDIGAYDHKRRLVVDPTIAWSSYLGGSDWEEGAGIAVDGSGNVFVAGYTYSSDFPSAGGFQTSYGGGNGDAFVAKIDPAGSSLVWSSYLGGSDDDFGYGLAVDSSGDVYVAGLTRSTDFPSSGGFATSLAGLTDAFVAKVDAAGSSLVWSSYLGGSDDDFGYGVAADDAGNVYIVGTTYSSDFPTSGGFDTSLGGGVDAFVAKVDATGSSLAWSSYLGGNDYDDGFDVAVDGSGNAYLAGTTDSSDFPTSGGFGTSYGGSGDAFVTKVSGAGSSLAWSSYLGGNDYDDSYGVAVDGSGNAYVVGNTYSSDFPTSGGFDTSFDANGEAFVTKVDAAGSSLAWSSYLGGSGFDEGYDVAVDAIANVYVTGDTYSSDFPSAGGFDTSSDDANGDAFVARVDAAGASLTWSSYLGGSGPPRILWTALKARKMRREVHDGTTKEAESVQS